MANVKQLDDRDFPRDRGTRALVFFSTPIALVVFGGMLLGSLFEFFLSNPAFYWIGFAVGAGAGSITFLSIKHLFVVKNNSTGILMTINQLSSLFTTADPHVLYGNGTHFSFPWERRLAQNNIAVEEVAVNFDFTAICTDGTVTGKGSIRLRPDPERATNYLSGVGAVGEDVTELAKAFLSKWLGKKTIDEAAANTGELNEALHDYFVTGISDFEERFGVQLGDITVGGIRFTGDVEKTRNGINEARFVAHGTALVLGFETVAEMKGALKKKTITADDVDRARREFRFISGNVDGATVNRFEVDIKGLTPETAAAVSAFLQNPASAQVLRGVSGGTRAKAKP